MITDAAFAALAQRTYIDPPTYTGYGADQSIHAHLTQADGVVLVGFRGSKEPNDWALDFEAIPAFDHDTEAHGKLGLLHAGFVHGAETVYARVKASVTGHRVALYGHSLGGALALMTGALLMADGIPVERIVTFGAPRVGLIEYVNALATVAVDEYRYGNDIVPQVPSFMMHARPLIHVGAPRIDFLSCHHIENYIAAITALETVAA